PDYLVINCIEVAPRSEGAAWVIVHCSRRPNDGQPKWPCPFAGGLRENPEPHHPPPPWRPRMSRGRESSRNVNRRTVVGAGLAGLALANCGETGKGSGSSTGGSGD